MTAPRSRRLLRVLLLATVVASSGFSAFQLIQAQNVPEGLGEVWAATAPPESAVLALDAGALFVSLEHGVLHAYEFDSSLGVWSEPRVAWRVPTPHTRLLPVDGGLVLASVHPSATAWTVKAALLDAGGAYLQEWQAEFPVGGDRVAPVSIAEAARWRGAQGSDGIVLTIASGERGAWRGVVFHSEERDWTYATAGSPAGLTVVDLGGDGEEDILVGSCTVSNGWETRGAREDPYSTDERSHVVMLRANGTLAYLLNYDETGCLEPFVMELDDVVPPDVLLLESHESVPGPRHSYVGTAKVHRVAALDGEAVSGHDAGVDTAWSGAMAVQGDADPQRELLLLTRTGELRVLDADLEEPLHAAAPGYSKMLGAADMDHNGATDFVVAGTQDGRGVLAILDERFERVLRRDLPMDPEGIRSSYVGDVNGDGRPEVLVVGSRAIVYSASITPAELGLGLLGPAIAVLASAGLDHLLGGWMERAPRRDDAPQARHKSRPK